MILGEFEGSKSKLDKTTTTMLTVHKIRLIQHELRTRFPFRYGIASMTCVPYLMVEADVSLPDGRAIGMSADLLPPKWFTKNPATDFEKVDLPEMQSVISHAGRHAESIVKARTFFGWWRKLYAVQSKWAESESIPPLLANFGVSLMERAVIDAICRIKHKTLYQILNDNDLQLEFGDLRTELADITPRDVVAASPSETITVRHTVGMGDPLTDAEIDPAERVDDGLPQSLVENIREYGLTHFKIKLSGKLEDDRNRLLAIRDVLNSEVGEPTRFTMDGNENFKDINSFRECYESLNTDHRLRDWFSQQLLFVEQPIHRDYALADSVREELCDWPDAPPLIIDESDAELDSLPRALQLGYSGTSHKNCKGIVKGLLNAATIHQRKRAGLSAILSAEDLANLPPIALLQDLTMASLLGIPHVERNGHHYFAGMSQWTEEIQDSMLRDHPDLFRRHSRSFAAVAVHNGQLSIASLLQSPFGVRNVDEIATVLEGDA